MKQYNDEIRLKDLLVVVSDYKSFLFKKKAFVFFFSCFFLLLGVFYSFYKDIEYTADLTFVVEGESSISLGGMAGLANQFGFDFGGGLESNTFSQSNVIELLKSRGVVDRTLMQKVAVNNKEDLIIEHYLEINKIRAKFTADFERFSFYDENTYKHDSIRGLIWESIIENNIIITKTDEANIITLSYVSLNEEFAKVFVQTLISQMSQMYVSHQTAQANNTLNFLQNRADSVFLALETAEEDFARVKDINERIVKASGRLKELQLMRRVEVLNTMYLEIIKNLELSKITLLQQTPIINIIDKPILPLKTNSNSTTFFALIGFFLGGFLSVFYLICNKLFKDTLNNS